MKNFLPRHLIQRIMEHRILESRKYRWPKPCFFKIVLLIYINGCISAYCRLAGFRRRTGLKLDQHKVQTLLS